jgi:hypothetical protein
MVLRHHYRRARPRRGYRGVAPPETLRKASVTQDAPHRRRSHSHAVAMNIGRSLMAAPTGSLHNLRMNASDCAPTPADPAETEIVELRAKLDERDETIRLLNEALSLALDDLRLDEAA